MKIDCPVCHARKSLEITTHLENIPYFGEIMESTLICHECGYRYSDVLCFRPWRPHEILFMGRT
jgi:C4-type Zn-finger protein